MANQTMRSFGYPDSCIAETSHWVVLLRPQQVTAGCLILACKEEARSLGAISADAGAALPSVVARLEAALKATYGPEKFNYLALMMVDPHVHFHVIPRYSEPTIVDTVEIVDHGWPRHPRLDMVADLSAAQMRTMMAALEAQW
jgi:diadenosine tetraphosphate (Ap4A) HIT family hydrolase